MSRETCVRWLGMSSVYTTDERAVLAALPVREQAFLHTLKAFMEGELSSALELVPTSGAVRAEESGAGERRLDMQSRDAAPEKVSTLYTDPEDIPFGDGAQTPRKRPVYALVWTWRQSRVFKTKRECIEKQRVWKKWYERQGWKVTSHATGYFARHPSGQAHSISLHEYDKDSHERLR